VVRVLHLNREVIDGICLGQCFGEVVIVIVIVIEFGEIAESWIESWR
jgi:hypothetical protein